MLDQDLLNWRDRLGERFRAIIQEHQGDLWEFVAAFFSIAWGLWILNPWLVSMPADMPVYRILTAQAPEWLWGAAMVVTGLGRWWSILAFGKERSPQCVRARRVTASALGVLFLWIQVMLLLGDVRGGGPFPCYEWVGALIAFWRAATPPKRQG